MDLTHNPHLRDIDHALSAEVNASQRQRVALPPFDSLRDGDIVTLHGVIRSTEDALIDIEIVDADGEYIGRVIVNRHEYATCVQSVERAS